MAHVYYPSVTPNCPTFVCNTPVLYYIQFEVQNVVWQAIKIKNTSVDYNFTAWQIANIKNVIENESHPWSNNCPNGELLFVLLACFPSTASNVEYIKMHAAAK